MGLSAAAAGGSGGWAPPPPAAPLLPKLRGHCAEFLDHGSPDRLGMLYLPTCVGFGTGARSARPRGFSREHGVRGFARGLRLASRPSRPANFAAGRPTCFHVGVQNHARVSFSVAAGTRARRGRYGNVRPLRIGYAFRPRLSTRLTLGGLASPRKPWASGGRVSRSSPATHASILACAASTAGRPCRFARSATLPYRRALRARPAASAPCLAPRIVGAPPLDQ